MSRTGLFWVNFDPSDLEKAKQFMDNLKGDRTVDVLGLSRSMEAVSNILFPATSTLHKRIRYQIFVPAIFWTMYSRTRRFDPEKALHELERQLQETLIRSGEDYGVFGFNAREALKYWPSLVYWSSLNALKVFGNTTLGRYDALEIIEERIAVHADKNQDHTEVDVREIDFCDEVKHFSNKMFLNGKMCEKLTFALTKQEARFLKDQFFSYYPDSITSYVLKTRSHLSDNAELFQMKCPRNKRLDDLLFQSENYSRTAMGANYAYRWALCRAKKIKSAEQINWKHLRYWIDNNRNGLSNWKFNDLVATSNQIDPSFSEKNESSFLDKFIHLAFTDRANQNTGSSELFDLMRRREEEIKGRHMSHFNNEKLQAARNILGKEEYRDLLFDYRWPQGRSNLIDIFSGLKRK